MKKEQDPGRTRPTEKGSHNDPNLHDDSALQPGVSTISSSDTDDKNDAITRTGADSFRTSDDDPYADPSFDEIREK